MSGDEDVLTLGGWRASMFQVLCECFKGMTKNAEQMNLLHFDGLSLTQ